MSDQGMEPGQAESGGPDKRPEDVALAIKRCLDSLADDARQSRMLDLAHFIGLAALAAEDAARACRPADPRANLLDREPVGSC